jgi:hypothetical protein
MPTGMARDVSINSSHSPGELSVPFGMARFPSKRQFSAGKPVFNIQENQLLVLPTSLSNPAASFGATAIRSRSPENSDRAVENPSRFDPIDACLNSSR